MARSVQVGGIGAALGIEDVCKVAAGAAVALDSAASTRVKKDSPPPNKFVALEGPPAAGLIPDQWLEPQQARAAVLVRVLGLVNGRSRTRLTVLQYLINLLNAHTPPALAAADTDAAALAGLTACLRGAGEVLQRQQRVPQVEKVPEPAPQLSADELAAVSSGQPVTAGIGALAVQGGLLLLSAANAVAALSAEVLQASVAAFDPAIAEAQPHKGAVEVAAELSSLLEGYSKAKPRKGGAGAVSAVTALPQIHGDALDSLRAAAAAVRAALGSVVVAPDKLSQVVPSPTLARSLLAASQTLHDAIALSVERTSLITKLSGMSDGAVSEGANMLLPPREAVAQLSIPSLPAAIPGVRIALVAHAAVRQLQAALAVELWAGLRLLRRQEVSKPSPSGPTAPTDNEPKKKKEKGGGALVQGKGSLVLRAAAEAALQSRPEPSRDTIADGMGRLSTENGDTSSSGSEDSGPLLALLDPYGEQLGPQLQALRAALEANQVHRMPKVPKGTRDFLPRQMMIRKEAFRIITAVFERHGAVAIDTPVFEVRETLMGKYGEDSKLIYDLADQGGEILCLRYDLTVPFARFVAVNGIKAIKRYHIGRVYRRDQPAMNRGRYREFFQCDFDIAGEYPTMVPDAEVIKVVVNILQDLQLGEFEVKLNHRAILDAMLEIAGVPPNKFRSICSAVDKLDKAEWSEVRAEMVQEKGLAPEVADRIGEMVFQTGQPFELLDKLSGPDNVFSQHPQSKAALEELRLLFGFLKRLNVLAPVKLDLTLARGLDYYTGVIYEAVLKGGSPAAATPEAEGASPTASAGAEANVGSIAGGGRYDRLVGMFSSNSIPAVGVSIGIERVFSILERRFQAQADVGNQFIRETETEVLVASTNAGLQGVRMEIAAELQAAGIKAEFGFKANPPMPRQIATALADGIPFLVIVGDNEVAAGTVNIKDLRSSVQTTEPRTKLVPALQLMLAAAPRSILAPKAEEKAK